MGEEYGGGGTRGTLEAVRGIPWYGARGTVVRYEG